MWSDITFPFHTDIMQAITDYTQKPKTLIKTFQYKLLTQVQLAIGRTPNNRKNLLILLQIQSLKMARSL